MDALGVQGARINGMFLSTDLQTAGLSRLYSHLGKGVGLNAYTAPVPSDIAIGERRLVEFCKRNPFVWPISDISPRLELSISPLPRSSSLLP